MKRRDFLVAVAALAIGRNTAASASGAATCARRVVTGFPALDGLIDSPRPGELVVVAAPPAMGKTAFGVGLAEHVAYEQALPVLFFSIGASARSLTNRFLSSIGRICPYRLRTGRLWQDEVVRMRLAMGRLKKMPLHIQVSEVPAACSSPQVFRVARCLQRRLRGGLGLIIVDDAWRLAGREHQENVALRTENALVLKALAQELNVPVVAMSRHPALVENDGEYQPSTNPLPAGPEGEVADLLMFLYRDEVFNFNSRHTDTAEVTLTRRGARRIGTVRLAFLGEYSRFENLPGA